MPATDPEETHMIALRQPVPADVLQTILDCAGVAYGPLTVTVEGDWMILSQK